MKRTPAWFERVLAREGMPREPPAQPSWRQLSTALLRDGPRRAPIGVGIHVERVELPSDRDNHQQTVLDRARNFLSDAQMSPGYNGRLEELYWRGDWRGYPKWHRALVWSHVNDGTTVAEFARTKRRPYAQAWRALEEHKRRAGIGGGDMGGDVRTNGSIEKQATRVEQTSTVRVKAVFAEKLPMHLGLGNISWAEGELVMGGRFVKVEFPAERPHPSHDHVLIPVGPGVFVAVLKD